MAQLNLSIQRKKSVRVILVYRKHRFQPKRIEVVIEKLKGDVD